MEVVRSPDSATRRKALFGPSRPEEGPVSGAASESAYVTQYTALIVIILSFVIAAYAVRGVSQLPTISARQLVTERVIASFRVSEIIVDGTINPAPLESVAVLLKAHDLWLTGTIAGVDGVALASTITEHLLTMGVPPSAIKVYAGKDRAGEGDKLVLYAKEAR